MPTKTTKPPSSPEPSQLVISPAMIRDALLSLSEDERAFVITDPGQDEHKIYSVRRNALGNLEYDYQQTPE